MLFSWGGEILNCERMKVMGHMACNQEAIRTMKAIHHAGVLHKGPTTEFFVTERKRLMAIDFERSQVLESPSVLSPVSGNKRQRAEDQDPSHAHEDKPTVMFEKEGIDIFLMEQRHAKMGAIVGW